MRGPIRGITPFVPHLDRDAKDVVRQAWERDVKVVDLADNAARLLREAAG
ncbi:hypothetical protein AB0C38_23410 [Amycolatopsis sp. NPDC048633]